MSLLLPSTIDLRCMQAVELIEDVVPDGSVDFVMADPPWTYSDGAERGSEGAGLRGLAKQHYDGMSEQEIAEDLASTTNKVGDDAYMVVWCTFPKLFEWARQDAIMLKAGWKYVSGGAWGKTNGLGAGFHFRGDAEPILLYKKGHPQPFSTQSNLLLSGLDVDHDNLVLARRQGHSEKPQSALRALLALCCTPGGTVLDPYAGETASLMRACRATGFGYIGAELDPRRYKRALDRYALEEQTELLFTDVENDDPADQHVAAGAR